MVLIMNRQTELTSELKVYLWWPIVLSLFLIAMTACVFTIDSKSGVFVACFVVVYVLFAILMFLMKRPKINSELVKYAGEFGQVQRRLIKELNVAYAVLDKNARIMWGNDEFCNVIEGEIKTDVHISEMFTELDTAELPNVGEDLIADITYKDKYYNACVRRVVVPAFDAESDSDDMLEKPTDNIMYVIYLYDRSDVVSIIQENHDEKLVFGLLYIDNYNEAIESIDESKRPLIATLVERKITKYFNKFDAYMTKVEKDRFVFVMRQKNLDELKADKFAIVDDIRNATKDGKGDSKNTEVTISIGISEFTGSTAETFLHSKEAMELTIGRGGNSVTIMDKDGKAEYYGGKNISVERNNEKVRARVRADAIKEFVSRYGTLFVMGHRNCDSDAFGSAIGVVRYVRELGKEAYIVLEDEIKGSVLPMIERIDSNKAEFGDLIIKADKAETLIGDASALIVVDTAVGNMVAAPVILEKFAKEDIIVIDHHRQGTEVIEASALYIEPYASSVSELVTELIQISFPNLRITPVEAEAMYSGIYIDTNNFTLKTGTRTFEVAAYLKKCGADLQRIRKMFRIDQNDYVRKSRAINATEIFRSKYALTYCSNKENGDTDELAAQVANELLNISGISGSFVATERGEMYKVSARSIDELNVEIIMKHLGGGGHGDAAAAVFEASNAEEALKIVKNAIITLTDEGKI